MLKLHMYLQWLTQGGALSGPPVLAILNSAAYLAWGMFYQLLASATLSFLINCLFVCLLSVQLGNFSFSSHELIYKGTNSLIYLLILLWDRNLSP